MPRLDWTDTSGEASLASPARRFCGWTPDTSDVGEFEESLATGVVHAFSFRTDYFVSFELPHIAASDVALLARLKRHLMRGGAVTVVTDDLAEREYVCGWRNGTEIRWELDRDMLTYTLSLTLLNRSAGDLVCTYEGATGIPPSDDIAQLVADLGGDAVAPAIYDGRRGVTVSAGVVDAWADARGAGFGPSLVGAGTARPAYASGTLTFDGVDDTLKTAAASALFDVNGARSLVVVGTLEGGTGDRCIAAMIDGAGNVRDLSVRSASSSANIGAAISGGAYANSGVARSATRRLMVASKAATSGVVAIDVPDAARATASGSSPAAGNNFLVVGSRFGDSHFALGTVRAVLVLNRQATSADLATLKAWAVANHAAVAA